MEGSDASLNRVGGRVNDLLENGGVSATITGDASKTLVNSNNRIGFNALDKKIIKGTSIIKELCRDIHVSKQVEQNAIQLLAAVERSEEFKGSNYLTKAASVIMIASRKFKMPKNMKEICKGAGVSTKQLSHCVRHIQRKVCPSLNFGLKPQECIIKLASKLSLDGEVEDKCKEVATFLHKNEYLTGKNPLTIAGVAIYMVTQLQEKGKQKSLGDISRA